MSTPVVAVTAQVSSLINFAIAEFQILAVTSTTASGAFTTAAGIAATDCMVSNSGTSSAYLVFSSAASPTALNAGGGASGTTYTYLIMAGQTMVVQKGQAAYFAAITDSSTTTLALHAGRGS